jgi:pilin isopeptide linkage protein/LPXTG-motif cell wall-anchored protein
MDKLLLQDAEPYASAHRRKRRWYQVMTCLAAAVVFCTTYALILPAITLEKQCEIPEHTHTEACYTSVQGDLICTQSTEPQHTHTEECYQETQDLVCGMPESTGHTHGAECYDQEGNLICGQEESEGHVHGEACYGVSRQLICGQTEEPAHQHTDACYSWNQVLTCGMEEHTHSEACTATEPEKAVFCGKEPHTHGESCRDEQGELTCGMEEHTHSEACTATEPEEAVFCGKEPHTHGESCRNEQGELTCTLEEHTHSLACYADPTADVETAEIWEQTFGDVTLTGDWRLDALAIARSQLGYAESTRNYAVAEDGQTLMGYTRYGAWKGDPYGDWNALFAAFCLHYGGAENIPTDKDCGSWAAALADAFLPAQSHEAAPGELVFFDRDGDGTADWVAIVAEVTAGEEGAPSGITVIAGDVDNAVQQRSYALEDPTILGYYGSLPEQAKAFTLTAQTESGITVTVTGDSASLPFPVSEITLTAAEVAEEQGQAIREQLPAEEGTEPEQRFLLDISLRHGEEEIEPVGPVTVTFSGLDTQGLYPKVYHIDTEAQEVTDMEAEKTETGDVAMVTEHFSTYAISLVAARDLSGTILADTFQAGGEYTLAGDVQTAENIGQVTITTDTTIDLNGHTLTISKDHQCFVVQYGAKLTIMDSKAPSEETVDLGGSNPYGNTASLSEDGSTLTYYITESTANGTGTTETLIKHKVPLANAGKILCKEGSDQVIKVENGGTLELKSGVLQGTGVRHIVYVEDGTLNVSGGYIVGGGSDDMPGGGIYVGSGAVKGTVNIQGGVVAANRGNFGGGIYVVGGELTISGGAVTGNTVFNGHDDDGGGIYVNSGTLKLSGNGYVTNNSKSCDCTDCPVDTNNTHGGGGIALANGSTMEMSGGYVTGNFSSLAGGGIYAGYYAGDGGVNFKMTGGTIAANCAQYGEGGGLRIGGGNNGGTNGVIRTEGKVYITNNKTLTTDDWGGGGIFVQEGGHLSVMDALITNNKAGGFGGGVGACPTGKTLIVNEDGAAIYGNTAKGEQMSDGGNGKEYDTTVAKASTVFMQNGYTDYFCVRKKEGANDPISLVTGLMAGGGAANWKGSCDEKVVSIGKTGYAAAKYLFGLVAAPDDSAKDRAVAAAKVMITGNYSGVHGGGIMTNGGLILGNPGETKVVTATPELDITGTKALRKDGERQEGLKGFQFRFQLKDSDGKVVGEATADDTTGEFTFQDIEFSQVGVYTYTLSEVKGDRADVTYDTTVHTIQVTIKERTISLLDVKFTSYYVESVSVDGKEVGGSSGSGGDSQTGTFRVRFKKEEGWENLHMHVWADPNNPLTQWPGIQMNKDDTDGSYYYDLPVTGRGIYNYVFNIGSDAKKTKDITNVPYAPGKEALFDADGNVLSNTAADTGSTETGDAVGHGSNSDGSYTLTIPGDAFTNTMTTQLNLQITKTDSVDASKLLEGAKFTLKEQGQETSVKVTTDENGIATFTGIRRGATYELRETQAPSNYMTAGPWILEVGSEDATLYPATENPDGTLTQTGETGTPLTVSGTGPKVLSVTVRDIPWGYELPDTGGAGTTSYTAGGLALIFGAATLMYVHCKRRKEDEASS